MAGLANKVVAITGGSTGIGAGCALEFAKHGAKLVLIGRNQKSLDDVTRRCLEIGAPEVLQVIADVTKDEDVKSIVTKTLARFGTLHVLINNAGGSLPTGLATMVECKGDTQVLDHAYRISVKGPWQLCGMFVDELIKNKGCIINMSAVTSVIPFPTIAAYSIMKAGMNYMTQCMATELGMKGVRVNALLPGSTYTDYMQRLPGITPELGRETFKQIAEQLHVLEQKVMEPSDVGKSAVFLASDDASKITGVLLPVDCGALLANPAYDFTVNK